ncbi:GGDEF domain-containing protein [Psychrobium sp. MM17-31]|uniref:GGDEF domain-containing protein n=1 Tax=Psychrobium sp. MM17-31 TaxID=2917758 RepID=UPI001EF55669|nr:diguanylate cyclase [Psychrobium sp. MM17-31]MCG7532095.1 GGDEF domain-containing protein [Psychrobium sp. MM17-31]
MNSQFIEVDYCNRAQAFKWLWATVSFVQAILGYYAFSDNLYATPIYLANLTFFVVGCGYYFIELRKYKVFPNNIVLTGALIVIVSWLFMAHSIMLMWSEESAVEKVLLLGFFSLLMCFNSSRFMVIASTIPIMAAHLFYQVYYVDLSGMPLFVSFIKYPFFVAAIIITHVNHNTRLVESHRKLVELNKELTVLRNIDDLTAIYNRRAFDEKLNYLLELHNRNKQPVSLMILDVDYFKRYNDSLGHWQGDQCLKQIAKTLGEAVKRETDVVARVGGEEFGIILPNTDLDDCQIVAQNVINTLKGKQFPHPNSAVSSQVTVSIGCACIQGSISSYEAIYHRADQALYRAKEQGRNRYSI